MQQCLRLFSFFDTFPVAFTPSLGYRDNRQYYQSPLGGQLSILIYSFGLIYAVNLLKTWFNNEMVMKISTQSEEYDKPIYQDIFNNSKITNSFSISLSSNIGASQMDDPFIENDLIIIPLLLNLTSGEEINLLGFHNETTKTIDLVLNDSLEFNLYNLILMPCHGNEIFLNTGQQCGNKSKAANYFSSTGMQIDISVQTQYLEVYNREIVTKEGSPTLLVQQNLADFTRLDFIYSYYEIRSGWFFQQAEAFMLKTNYFENHLTSEKDYLQNYFLYWQNDKRPYKNILGAIQFNTDLSVNHVIVEYPNLSEVFASIGSTVQAFLLVKYLIFLLNRSRMIKDFKEYCKELYYPQLKQVIQKGKGKNKQYYYGVYQLEPKQFESYIRDIERKIEYKLNFRNLIYEISRMQIMMQELVSKEKIIESHQKRSELLLELDQKTLLYRFIKRQVQNYPKIILDSKIDPFIYNFDYESIMQISSQNVSMEEIKVNQNRPENVYFYPEVPFEEQNQPMSESMRPQQSL